MTIIILASVFYIGAILTSFLVLVAMRLPHQAGWTGEPQAGITIVAPRSFCDSCQATIQPLYLLPIFGWIFARGRCVECHAPVSKLYPLSETLCGIVCVILIHTFGYGWLGISSVILFLSLTFLSLIDVREYWLPHTVTVPLFWVGLLFSPVESHDSARIFGALLCFSTMFIAMLIAGQMRGEEAFAGGDLFLATAAGAWLGEDAVVFFLLVSSITFVAYGTFLRIHKKSHLAPMGPALAMAFFGGFIIKGLELKLLSIPIFFSL